MRQFLAIRPVDGRTFVIPASWSRNYQERGWRVLSAPSSLELVKQPTPMERVVSLHKTESVPPPDASHADEAASLCSSPGPEAASPAPSAAPKKKRKRRKKEA